MMTRTQIQFTEEQLRALKARAARDEMSVSKLVRTAVDALLRSEHEPSREERVRRALEMIGRFSGGPGDVAVEHDRYLADAFSE